MSVELFRRPPIGKDLDLIHLVFVHGLGGSSAIFHEAANQLKSFAVALFDLPGFGTSKRAARYSFAGNIEFLNSMVSDAGIDRFHLVGHSIGADIAVQWASTDLRVKSLVVVEPTFLSKGLAFPRAAVLADRDGSFHDWFDRVVVAENFTSSTKVQQALAPALKKCDPLAFLELSKELVSLVDRGGELLTPIFRSYQRLTTPTLTLLGGRSEANMLPLLVEEGLANYRILRDSGHWPMIEEPPAFYQFIADFVQNVEDKTA